MRRSDGHARSPTSSRLEERRTTPQGWVGSCWRSKLADGTATCLCKIYRSPRIRHDQLSKALNLSLEAPTMSPSSSGATLGPATQMASGPMNVQTPAAAEVMAPPMSRSSSGATLGPAPQMASGVMDDQTAAAAEVMAPPMPPSSSGATLGPATQMASGPMNVQTAAAAEVMATTSGLSQTPHAGSPTVALNVLSSASTSGPIDVLPAAAAAGHTAFSSETSPSTPKRWVTVQISDSPTRANDKSLARPKRVYSMILPAEEGSDSSAKKLKPVDCKGWLTIEPVPCTDSAIA